MISHIASSISGEIPGWRKWHELGRQAGKRWISTAKYMLLQNFVLIGILLRGL
jgi:hypothetical protein